MLIFQNFEPKFQKRKKKMKFMKYYKESIILFEIKNDRLLDYLLDNFFV